MPRIRVHLTAPITGVPVYFERETIKKMSEVKTSLVSAIEKSTTTDLSNDDAEVSKLHTLVQAARLALESARGYRYVELDGTASDCISGAAPGWISLSIEPTSETENYLVTELCALCDRVGSAQETGNTSGAFAPSLYLRAATSHFVVPNRLISAFQDITSTA